jgi:hypothetical protein
MRKSGIYLTCVTLIATMLLSPGIGEAARKKVQVRDYHAQTRHAFPQSEEGPAYGMVINLSNAAWVITEPQTGLAGPFGDISGSGSGEITLANPGEPIAPGGSVTLTFRTLKKKLAVKQWWWLDERGKRLGKKHKGHEAPAAPATEPAEAAEGP